MTTATMAKPKTGKAYDVKDLNLAEGGRLRIESRPGLGTRVTAHLPIVVSP